MKPWSKFKAICPKCANRLVEVESESFNDEDARQVCACDACGCKWENRFEWLSGCLIEEGEL